LGANPKIKVDRALADRLAALARRAARKSG